MTASTFGWLDHDEGERRRMMEVVDLFREKGTLDELGIGAIRDTWAEHFFPGTSTIQSRARYFLFIPWLYGLLEHDRVPSNRADGHARKLQWRLVQSLRAGGEGASKGVIGIEAGEHLQRRPDARGGGPVAAPAAAGRSLPRPPRQCRRAAARDAGGAGGLSVGDAGAGVTGGAGRVGRAGAGARHVVTAKIVRR